MKLVEQQSILNATGAVIGQSREDSYCITFFLLIPKLRKILLIAPYAIKVFIAT